MNTDPFLASWQFLGLLIDAAWNARLLSRVAMNAMEANTDLNTVLADVVLVVHFAFVVFVIGGFAVIWIGRACRWSFVRNFGFRLVHALAMGFVAFQVIADIPCPLTTLERSLRERAGQQMYEGSCIEHWLGRILFYDLDEWVFAVAYLSFFALIVLTFWKVPPRWPKRFSRTQ